MSALASAMIGLATSTVVGVGLWSVLPRGVVLTRSPSGPDQWTIRNDSALPVVITSVQSRSAASPTGDELGFAENGPLEIDDENDAITESERGRRDWVGLVVRPGDTLTANIMTNTDLTIKYRRAGRTGAFEKRALEIHGSV